MIISAPVTVDVDKLVNNLNLSKTCTTNLKYNVYYFLSLVHQTEENQYYFKKNDGYRSISSVIMRNFFGNRSYADILEVLTNPDDPIIESNDSYHTSSIKSKGYCKKYRLTKKYRTDESIFIELPEKFDKKTMKKVDKGLEERFFFLKNQFNEHHLTLNPQVYDYIRAFGNMLIDKIDNKSRYQQQVVFAKVGKWLSKVKKMENGEYGVKISSKNHRLNSILTSMPKQLRKFLLCDGRNLAMVDITASHPFLLSSIMYEKFFKGTGDGFNLATIYPALYKHLQQREHSSAGEEKSTDKCEEKPTQDMEINSCGTHNSDTSIYWNECAGIFMWCNFFSKTEIESIVQYQNLPFSSDFYESVNTLFNIKLVPYESNPEPSIIRDKIKKNMMYVLFDDKMSHRWHNPFIRRFYKLFPGVGKWIDDAHYTIGKRNLSYLLQRSESYLYLNIICRKFYQTYPDIPIFTIHDGLYTTEEYLPVLSDIVFKTSKEVTGFNIGLKTIVELPTARPSAKELDKVYQKVQKVKTKEQFDKVKSKNFNSYLIAGQSFLQDSAR